MGALDTGSLLDTKEGDERMAFRFFQSLTSVYSCSKWVSTHFLPPALNSSVEFPCPVELPNKNNLSLSKLLVLQRV